MELEKPATGGETGCPFRLKPSDTACAAPSWYKIGTLTIRWVECGICAASRSAASCLFHLFLRFWNQILTWVSVRCRDAASPALSELLRYLFTSKVDSSWNTWLRLNTVRVFFFRLGLRSEDASCSERASFSSVRLLSPVFLPVSSLSSVMGSETAGEPLSLVDTEQQWSSVLVLILGPERRGKKHDHEEKMQVCKKSNFSALLSVVLFSYKQIKPPSPSTVFKVRGNK